MKRVIAILRRIFMTRTGRLETIADELLQAYFFEDEEQLPILFEKLREVLHG